MLPDWFRVVAAILIWIMFPLQLWAIYRGIRQHRRWEEAEIERCRRWERDLKEAAKAREEAEHLRALTEIALAQARRHLPNGNGNGKSEPTGGSDMPHDAQG